MRKRPREDLYGGPFGEVERRSAQDTHTWRYPAQGEQEMRCSQEHDFCDTPRVVAGKVSSYSKSQVGDMNLAFVICVTLYHTIMEVASIVFLPTSRECRAL